MSDFAKDNNTFDASWKLYDAERMANESLRQRLAEKDAEIERLKAYSVTRTHQLLDGVIAEAALQAVNQQLREALQSCVDYGGMTDDGWVTEKATQAIALPQDTSALEAMIAKAGEVMRDRVIKVSGWSNTDGVEAGFRAIPGVTLEDLKA